MDRRFGFYALFLIGFLGCGSNERLQRYAVRGSITHGGEPMKSGRIWFEPDASLGNKGPTGFALITNGEYATTARQGVIGGPHIAVIHWDVVPDYGESPGRGEKPEMRIKVDLPKASTTRDFKL